MKFSCSERSCSEMLRTIYELQRHLAVRHQITLEVEEIVFNSMEDFKAWKAQYQKANNVSYKASHLTQNKKVYSKVKVNHYFRCHRSRSSYEAKAVNRQSCKIDDICPSRMIVKEFRDSTVGLTFWKTHRGHKAEIGHTRLSPSDREEIADKAKQGIPPMAIIDQVREEVVHGAPIGRKHFLTKQDIANIVRSYNISYRTKCHEDDATSVKLWVDQNTGPEGPVLLFKEQGVEKYGMDKEDFMLGIMTPFQKSMMSQLGPKLICVDGTHGLNAYDFILHTILSVDEYGHGIPLAFLFSNRKDTNTIQIFFQKVQEACGTMKTNIFMTDDDPAYYNAWRNVMGEADHQLLCAWHILKNWNEKIKNTIPQEERVMIFEILRNIMKETSEDRFHVLLNAFLQKMGTDSKKQVFLDYFKKHYVNRAHVWAYCYRTKLGINTNMHLEALHKKIKYVYFDGKVVKRIDLAINVMMKITRDIIFERMIKVAKNVDTRKMQQIRRAHKASLEISEDMIVMEESNHWKVESQKGGFYDVMRINAACSESFCPLTCSQCKVCVHMFECNCFDHLLYVNICKHIHAVVISEELEVLPVQLRDREDIVIETAMQIPQCSASPALPVEDDVQTLLRKIIEASSNVSEDRATDMKDLLKRELNEVLNKVQKLKLGHTFQEKEVVNTRSKIEKQRKFHSTKKKSGDRASKHGKPTEEEQIQLGLDLLS
ncbi:hypothetical protein WDU94_002774 [Cyamophila willieti]